jgi:[FeFe] hydrogenase H-cluster maturation GTPase HydF
LARRKTRKGLRLHIGLFGRRNVGKSSLLNALTRQNTAIVSDFAGTTTDPVEKPMELQPLGPVLFIDTAGVDDEGALGELRVSRTLQVIDRTDLAVIISDSGSWSDFEHNLYQEMKKRDIPVIAVFSKSDLEDIDIDALSNTLDKSISCVKVSVKDNLSASAFGISASGLYELREAILKNAPDDWFKRAGILTDLVNAGDPVVLVVPVDKEAPAGRLILPQQQVIRELLDSDTWCTVVKERELRAALENMKRKPALVITDSQAFLKVDADTPADIQLTSFSILFARYQGDLNEFMRGAMAIDDLHDGDKVLIAESCSHHPSGEDIGRVKIPRWLRQFVGSALQIDFCQGHDFPNNLQEYKLVIHCGACMWNRREILNRILHCRNAGVKITNYGLAIAYSLGIFSRALKPFPATYDLYKELDNQE